MIVAIVLDRELSTKAATKHRSDLQVLPYPVTRAGTENTHYALSGADFSPYETGENS